MVLKIPPPILMLMALIVMSGCNYLLPWWQFNTLWVIAIPLIIIAMISGFLSVLALAKADTTISPFMPQQAARLVTRGIYQYSRNPMYASLLLLLMAAVFIYGELSTMLGIVFYVVVINHYQIKPEEKALLTLFGKEYAQYCRQVRRWF
ncbi:isoprenylcysteine carboxylmethyltransferase family protein [Photobacterium piscicola]|uniref:methyltransferase family protein n=1 Tax=Photobacterium piscicola TaxID=1378299 RepID=UPI002E17060D|nr:isoprenylcysteine carboxylmethyltransferase family protein [Photobacterium piscicola]MEC6882776.1 isoprenylcysteine carboxylmethyltransferase family protein [Photobacterium piscicola]